jgi:glycosyltransferase involved in cell wall biosynthesis
VGEDKLALIHSGVDLERFARLGESNVPDVLRGVPSGDVVVGTVAAFVGHKDYPNLLRAARMVLDSRANVWFCAVGDGPLMASQRKLASALGLGERFVFAGRRDGVGAFMRRFDVFVLASREEGLGTSVLDAQALGKPVVATRAGGIPDAVQDGVNGLLVSAGDSVALAGAIQRVVDSADLRRELGGRGRESVRRFSADSMVQEYVGLYSSLV